MTCLLTCAAAPSWAGPAIGGRAFPHPRGRVVEEKNRATGIGMSQYGRLTATGATRARDYRWYPSPNYQGTGTIGQQTESEKRTCGVCWATARRVFSGVVCFLPARWRARAPPVWDRAYKLLAVVFCLANAAAVVFCLVVCVCSLLNRVRGKVARPALRHPSMSTGPGPLRVTRPRPLPWHAFLRPDGGGRRRDGDYGGARTGLTWARRPPT